MYYLTEEDIRSMQERDTKAAAYLQSLEQVTEDIPCEIVEPKQLPTIKQ